MRNKTNVVENSALKTRFHTFTFKKIHAIALHTVANTLNKRNKLEGESDSARLLYIPGKLQQDCFIFQVNFS
ncbi:hypothetical protein HHUSO_G22670 [Huso huso]|uniref:Uncharacterized protein n=1 Tax=Huso huso TaxID=61971 RepID=A0ABR0YUN9_HUSHU